MLIARSLQEAGLYVELHPCECGAAGELTFSVIERDGMPVVVYQGDCPGCGRSRRFEFRIPAEPVAGPAYGGQEPSEIVDAGEFLWYSDRATEQAFRLSTETDDTAMATSSADRRTVGRSRRRSSTRGSSSGTAIVPPSRRSG
jgi:hypothetical protein